jgi:DNA repair protein RecN (Recombination protein N)
MLTELNIKNFAIIEKLQVGFGPGLNALTGETGAGKSILVDAISLILGGKASAEMIRTGAEEASVEAFFDFAEEEAAQILSRFALKGNEGLLIRRLINRSGKSRAYLNGSAITLNMLADLSVEIVNIYGQHEHQHFLEPKRHIEILDSAGDLLPSLRSYQEIYSEWLRSSSDLEELKRLQRQRLDRLELLTFQSQEIANAQLKEPRPGEPNEEEALNAERTRLVHAEKLFEIAHQGFEALYGEAGSVIERLKSTRHRLRDGEKIDPSISYFVQTLEAAIVQAEEAASSLRSYRDKILFDPKRLEGVESRLDEIRKLKRKYGAALEDVLSYKRKIDEERKTLEGLEEKISEFQRRVDDFYLRAIHLAQELSHQRQKAARDLGAKVEAELSTLGMKQACFQIRVEARTGSQEGRAEPILEEKGLDRVEFFLSPNPGEHLKPLAKIASGGELSRIMLALKRIFTKERGVRILIFDEVDAGIGGAVAEVVGRKLKDISREYQVFCITHLPQIASFADAHYKVAKRIQGERTRVEVERLDEEGRIQELARMLGGVKITGKTLEHAREMLKSAAGKK